MRFFFDEFVLDTSRQELLRRGVAVEVAPRAFQLLEYLLVARERVVGVEELQSEIWRVEALSPSAIPTCVTALRQALGDSADAPRYLSTVRGRGYRFIAEVREAAAGKPIRSTPLVGREQQLRVVQETFRSALTGGIRLVAVRGGPGTGKSRFLDECRSVAIGLGYVATQVAVPETGIAPSLWPWFEADSRARDLPGLKSLTDPQSQPTLPIVAHAPSDAGAIGPLESAHGLFLRFDAISRGLAQRAKRRPLAVLFDDFHRADGDSLSALDHILRHNPENRIAIVVAMRDSRHPTLQRHQAELLASPRATTLQINDFSASETASYVEQVRERPVDHAEIEAIHDATAGNPFLVAHTLSSAASRAQFEVATFRQDLGLLQRARSLARDVDEAALGLLETAAVIGRTFELAILSRITSTAPVELVGQLQQAIDLGLIERIDPTTLRFCHLLIRDALYGEIPIRDKATTHLRCAEALTEIGASAAEIAFHYGHALPAGGAKEALEYSRLAADEASSQNAIESVPTFLRSAVSAAEYCVPVPQSVRNKLLVELGEAQMTAANRHSAKRSLQRCVELAASKGDAGLVARAALAFAPGSLALEVGVHDGARERLLRTAIRYRSSLPTDTVVELLANLSLALAWSGNTRQQRDYAQEAFDLSASPGSDRTRASAIVAMWWVLSGPARLDERKALVAELGSIAKRTGGLDHLLIHQILNITTLSEAGQFDQVAREINNYQEDIRTSRLPHFSWYAELFDAMNLLRIGRFSEASSSAEQFLATGVRARDEGATISFATQCSYQLWERDRSARAISVASQAHQRYSGVSAWSAALSLFEIDAGDEKSARKRVAVALRDLPVEPLNPVWTGFASLLAESCHRLRLTSMAPRLREMLSPGSGQTTMLGLAVVSAGPLSRYLGLLAWTMGDRDEAMTHFRRAISQEEQHGGVPWCAKAKLDLSELLLEADATRNRDQVRELAGSALMSTAGTPLALLTRRAEKTLRQLEGSRRD